MQQGVIGRKAYIVKWIIRIIAEEPLCAPLLRSDGTISDGVFSSVMERTRTWYLVPTDTDVGFAIVKVQTVALVDECSECINDAMHAAIVSGHFGPISVAARSNTSGHQKWKSHEADPLKDLLDNH